MFVLRIKQIETALAAGRLDEACQLLAEPDVRAHRRGQALVTDVSQQLQQRAAQHLQAQQYEAALQDCYRAWRWPAISRNWNSSAPRGRRLGPAPATTGAAGRAAAGRSAAAGPGRAVRGTATLRATAGRRGTPRGLVGTNRATARAGGGGTGASAGGVVATGCSRSRAGAATSRTAAPTSRTCCR